jgi:hypothetical protein
VLVASGAIDDSFNYLHNRLPRSSMVEGKVIFKAMEIEG